MARKTAEQRRQEQAAEMQAKVDQFNETFDLRMLRVLNLVRSLADKFQVELQSQVLDVEEATLAELQESMSFQVTWYTEWNDREQEYLPAFRLKANDHTEVWHWDQALDNLEREIESELARQAEAKRKAELRSSALSKLSDEERAALNL